MLTLDEAIKHCEEKAKELRQDVNEHKVVDAEDIGDCIECANEHEKLAEWLKELKVLKERPQSDLISREWLKDAFDNLCCHDCKICRNFRIEDSFYKCALIENAPTEPQVTVFCENASKEEIENFKQELENVLERPQGEIKKYKPLEPDYNVQCAVENLKTSYWSDEPEKVAKDFTDAENIIISAICHHGYVVCKQSEQSQVEWIPVSERLPIRNGVYIVTRIIEGTPLIDASYFDGQNTWHRDICVNHGRPYLNDVIAWQPRPEPYKEGGAE